MATEGAPYRVASRKLHLTPLPEVNPNVLYGDDESEDCAIAPYEDLIISEIIRFQVDEIPKGYVEGDDFGSKYKDGEWLDLIMTYTFVIAILATVFGVIVLGVLWFLLAKKLNKGCERRKLGRLLVAWFLFLLVLALIYVLFKTFEFSQHGKEVKDSKYLTGTVVDSVYAQLNILLKTNFHEIEKYFYDSENVIAGDTYSRFKKIRLELEELGPAEELLRRLQRMADWAVAFTDFYRTTYRMFHWYQMLDSNATLPQNAILDTSPYELIKPTVEEIIRAIEIQETIVAIIQSLQRENNTEMAKLLGESHLKGVIQNSRKLTTDYFKQMESQFSQVEESIKSQINRAFGHKQNINDDVGWYLLAAVCFLTTLIVVLLLISIILGLRGFQCRVPAKAPGARCLSWTIWLIIISIVIIGLTVTYQFLFGMLLHEINCKEKKVGDNKRSNEQFPIVQYLSAKCEPQETLYETLLGNGETPKLNISQLPPDAVKELKCVYCNFTFDSLRASRWLGMADIVVEMYHPMNWTDICEKLNLFYTFIDRGQLTGTDCYYRSYNRVSKRLSEMHRECGDPDYDVGATINDIKHINLFRNLFAYLFYENETIRRQEFKTDPFPDIDTILVDSFNKYVKKVNDFMFHNLTSCKRIMERSELTQCPCDTLAQNGIWIYSFVIFLFLLPILLLSMCLRILYRPQCSPPDLFDKRTTHGKKSTFEKSARTEVFTQEFKTAFNEAEMQCYCGCNMLLEESDESLLHTDASVLGRHHQRAPVENAQAVKSPKMSVLQRMKNSFKKNKSPTSTAPVLGGYFQDSVRGQFHEPEEFERPLPCSSKPPEVKVIYSNADCCICNCPHFQSSVVGQLHKPEKSDRPLPCSSKPPEVKAIQSSADCCTRNGPGFQDSVMRQLHKPEKSDRPLPCSSKPPEVKAIHSNTDSCKCDFPHLQNSVMCQLHKPEKSDRPLPCSSKPPEVKAIHSNEDCCTRNGPQLLNSVMCQLHKPEKSDRPLPCSSKPPEVKAIHSNTDSCKCDFPHKKDVDQPITSQEMRMDTHSEYMGGVGAAPQHKSNRGDHSPSRPVKGPKMSVFQRMKILCKKKKSLSTAPVQGGYFQNSVMGQPHKPEKFDRPLPCSSKPPELKVIYSNADCCICNCPHLQNSVLGQPHKPEKFDRPLPCSSKPPEVKVIYSITDCCTCSSSYVQNSVMCQLHKPEKFDLPLPCSSKPPEVKVIYSNTDSCNCPHSSVVGQLHEPQKFDRPLPSSSKPPEVKVLYSNTDSCTCNGPQLQHSVMCQLHKPEKSDRLLPCSSKPPEVKAISSNSDCCTCNCSHLQHSVMCQLHKPQKSDRLLPCSSKPPEVKPISSNADCCTCNCPHLQNSVMCQLHKPQKSDRPSPCSPKPLEVKAIYSNTDSCTCNGPHNKVVDQPTTSQEMRMDQQSESVSGAAATQHRCQRCLGAPHDGDLCTCKKGCPLRRNNAGADESRKRGFFRSLYKKIKRNGQRSQPNMGMSGQPVVTDQSLVSNTGGYVGEPFMPRQNTQHSDEQKQKPQTSTQTSEKTGTRQQITAPSKKLAAQTPCNQYRISQPNGQIIQKPAATLESGMRTCEDCRERQEASASNEQFANNSKKCKPCGQQISQIPGTTKLRKSPDRKQVIAPSTLGQELVCPQQICDSNLCATQQFADVYKTPESSQHIITQQVRGTRIPASVKFAGRQQVTASGVDMGKDFAPQQQTYEPFWCQNQRFVDVYETPESSQHNIIQEMPGTCMPTSVKPADRQQVTASKTRLCKEFAPQPRICESMCAQNQPRPDVCPGSQPRQQMCGTGAPTRLRSADRQRVTASCLCVVENSNSSNTRPNTIPKTCQALKAAQKKFEDEPCTSRGLRVNASQTSGVADCNCPRTVNTNSQGGTANDNPIFACVVFGVAFAVVEFLRVIQLH